MTSETLLDDLQFWIPFTHALRYALENMRMSV